MVTVILLACPVFSCGLDDIPQEDISTEGTPARISTPTPSATPPIQKMCAAGACLANHTTANCDGCDPIQQGCASDAVTVQFNTGPAFWWGTLELRWSNKCQTNWTRFTANYGSVWDVSVERQSPHARVGDGPLSIASGGQHYTNMVYAPGPAQACANDSESDVGLCTGFTH